MPGCEDYSAMLSASLDGELTPEEKEALGAHLLGCPSCSTRMRLLQTISGQLREAQVKPPEKLKKGILYQVELEASRKRFRFGAYGRWTAIAAVICLAVLGIVKLAPLGGAKTASGAAYMTANSAPREPAPANALTGAGFDAAVNDGEQEAAAATEALPENGYDSGAGGLMMTAPAPVPMPDAAPEELEKTAVPNGMAAGEPELSMEPSAANDMDALEVMPAATAAPADGGSADGLRQNAQYRVEELPGYAVYQSLKKNAPYYSVCILYGVLPESVSAENGCTQLEAPEGQQRWSVPLETVLALELNEEFDEIYYADLMADQGLVVVLQEEE